MIVGLCEKFGCLPSQLLQEDASLLQAVAIVARARPDEHKA